MASFLFLSPHVADIELYPLGTRDVKQFLVDACAIVGERLRGDVHQDAYFCLCKLHHEKQTDLFFACRQVVFREVVDCRQEVGVSLLAHIV